jgi:GWxTD domain-containing protein
LKYFIKLIVLSLLPPCLAHSQDRFTFDYDYAFFRGADSKIFVEFYYSFYQNQLVFVKSNGGFEADGMLDLDVFDKVTNIAVVQKTYKVPITIGDTTGYNKNSKLTGQINLLLDTGTYDFHIRAADFNDTARNVFYDKEITVPRFDDKNCCLSSIQVAAIIRKSSDTENLFYKNTLEVIPNPSRLFGNNLSELFYYVELYNLFKENLSEQYSVSVDVTDLNDIILKSASKNYKLKNDTKVEYGQLNVSDLKTNVYRLVVKLLDNQNNIKAESRNQFVIYNTDTSQVVSTEPQADFLASEYVSYSEKKLEQEFEYASYLMNDELKRQYPKLTSLDVKRKLMFNFWKALDPNPLTPANEFKEEYLQRIKYANDNFAEGFVEGWKSDRGRVYAIYGTYDDIERHPFESSTRAYEIWTYNKIQGGVIFVFVDIGSVQGNYILAHSTARNELHDEDWKRRLNVRR